VAHAAEEMYNTFYAEILMFMRKSADYSDLGTVNSMVLAKGSRGG
jgi:hypothetical protein